MPLTHLREQIDEIDQQLITLLSKRLALVSEVGHVKSTQGIPLYVPMREAEMIQARRTEAEKQSVPPNLIEDILRRVMRESYANENKHGFKTVNPDIQKIVIVGGKGKLGGLFGRFLTQSGYKVESLDQADWENAADILNGADVVIVCVPIIHTLSVIEQLQPYLTPNMLLADLTSIKRAPLEKMLAVHKGAVVGLHPMFGPDITSMAKQVVACCDEQFC